MTATYPFFALIPAACSTVKMALAAGYICLLASCASQEIVSAASPVEAQTPESEALVKRAKSRLALSASYFENGQYQVALEEFKKVMKITPDSGNAHNLGGMIYMALGDDQSARKHFQRAIDLNVADANAWHNLGWLQCEGRHYAEAAQSFGRALAVPRYANQARTLMSQGICEARSGDRGKAEATLIRAYELDAGNPVTGYNLSQLLYLRGDYPRAQFYIRRLNNGERANAESLWLGIKVERHMNNTQAMQQLASQLSRRYPQSNELLSYERGTFDD